MNSPSTPPRDLTSQYLWLFSGQLVSQLGSSIVQFVIIWYITAVTNSGLALSTAALLGVGSSFITGLFAGVIADRYDRKKIMIVSDTFQALASFVLMYLFYLGIANLIHIYMLLFVRGLLGGIQGPAAQAVIPSMIPKERLSRINSLTSFSSSLLNLSTPVLAAVLLGIFGTTNMVPLLAIDGVTFVIGVIPLFLIYIPKDHVKTRNEKQDSSFRSEFKEGLDAIKNGPGMIALLFSFAMTNFFLTAGLNFLPLVVRSPLGLAGNEFILALGLSGMQVGNLLASSVLLKKRLTTGLVRKLTIGIVGGLIGLMISGTGVILGMNVIFVIGLVILGLMIPIAGISSSVIWQTYYPIELQGRIFTVRSTISQIVVPLSLISIGFLTEFLPISLRYLLFGSGLLGSTLYALIYNFTRIKEIDSILDRLETQSVDHGAEVSGSDYDSKPTAVVST